MAKIIQINNPVFSMLPYVKSLALLLHDNAIPADAVFMKKYMLNQFEYFGIRSKNLKELRREFIKANGLPAPGDLDAIVEVMWQQPEREFQYVGIDLVQRQLKKKGETAIGLIEFMITHKSWWDTVDWIAAHHAGTYFRLYPQHLKSKTAEWMDSGNIWLQRSALLFQLKYKRDTDQELLFNYIMRLKTSKEFFIRKAIGWVLREYSKTSPDQVIGFVERNNDLAGLSRREALKWIERKTLKPDNG